METCRSTGGAWWSTYSGTWACKWGCCADTARGAKGGRIIIIIISIIMGDNG